MQGTRKIVVQDNLRCALLYLARGLSVIPLRPDKKPYFEWKDYQAHRATEAEIKKWFKTYPDANVGIVTGKISGIVVVDVDAAHGGLETLEWLVMPDTPTVQTGGGGYHFYYKHPGKEVSNFQMRDEVPGVDLRGDGGYVVAPPSTHQTGKDYVWLEGKEIDFLALADLPKWVTLDGDGGDKAPVKSLYQGVTEGSRNQSLARIAGSWIRDGLSLAECVELAEVWNERNKPSIPKTELERTVKSIYEKHYSNGEDFEPDKVLQLGKVLKNQDVKVEWLVDRLIPKGSITLLTGRGGIGKTYLSLQIAKAVSKGQPFMGMKTMKMPVTYVDYENALAVLIERIRQLEVDDVLFWHTTNPTVPPRLDSPSYMMFAKLPKGLVIFDTLRASHLKDENESKDMAMIMTRLKELRDTGYTVIILHHTPKANGAASKGSTAIPDLSDHVLSMQDVSLCAQCRGEGYTMGHKPCPKCGGKGRIGPYKYLRVGTQGKTRYKPFQTFLIFSDDGAGFTVLKDKAIWQQLLTMNKDI